MAAQSQVYQLFSDKLFAVCLKYSSNYEDAEDTLQDSFISIFSNIKQYKHKGSFEGWLKKIAINTALQKYRKTAPLELVKEDSVNDQTSETFIDESIFTIDVLLDFVQKLPDRYRLVFNLYALDDYSHKEIATLLKISEGTSKSNLSRARKILREKLENYKQNSKVLNDK